MLHNSYATPAVFTGAIVNGPMINKHRKGDRTLKIEAALRHIAEAGELVKNDLHAMNYSNFCVRFASHLIFNEFRNELER